MKTCIITIFKIIVYSENIKYFSNSNTVAVGIIDMTY